MIDLNPPEGMTKFYFDKNMINDMGIKIQASGGTVNVEAESGIDTKIKKQCFTCNKLVTWSDMRCHVGTHIVKEELSGINICGFCGRDVCSITLKKTPKKGYKLFFELTNGIVIIFTNMEKLRNLIRNPIHVKLPSKRLFSKYLAI